MSSYDETIANRLMQDLMRDFHLTRQQASGIVGNLAYESGGFRSMQEADPMVPGSRGGWGYAQWTGPRRRNFEAFAASRGLDPSSYDANYGFLAHELSTDHAYSLNHLRSAGTPHEAAVAFADHYEYPDAEHAHMDRRKQLSKNVYLNPKTGFEAPKPTERPQPSLSPGVQRKGDLGTQPTDGRRSLFGAPNIGPRLLRAIINRNRPSNDWD